MNKYYEKALQRAFEKNRHKYGFEVTSVSEASMNWPSSIHLRSALSSSCGSEVDVSWIFKSGETYCCEERGCHTILGLERGSERAANDCLQKWKLIRSFLPRKDEAGIARIIFRVTHIIEAGCRFDGIPGLDPETVKVERRHNYVWIEPKEDELWALIYKKCGGESKDDESRKSN